MFPRVGHPRPGPPDGSLRHTASDDRTQRPNHRAYGFDSHRGRHRHRAFRTPRLGEIAQLRIWLANDASRPVAVASYRRSCGCTSLEFDSQPIAPGDARQVTLTFDSRGEWGWQLKTLDISLAGAQQPLRLLVEADIK